ncbi:hypothetical protein MFLAVUS_009764 [Mucor flavus]|uniref:Uncharacterized protein n=1 Tax=Mucor flavus TaxID=439312 RepID=A0ABP9ZAU5_9FUNG
MSNEMNDTEYLVQALLAQFKEENVEIHNYDALMIEEKPEVHDNQDDAVKDLEERLSETSYDWDNITDVEEEENYVEATRVLPLYFETVSRDERVKELIALFEKEFPVSKLFSDKADARSYIRKIRYKHFGSYRVGKKAEEEEEKDTGKDFIKKPSIATEKMGCTAFINVRVDNKSPVNP